MSNIMLFLFPVYKMLMLKKLVTKQIQNSDICVLSHCSVRIRLEKHDRIIFQNIILGEI